jgi:hypothetical protein
MLRIAIFGLVLELDRVQEQLAAVPAAADARGQRLGLALRIEGEALDLGAARKQVAAVGVAADRRQRRQLDRIGGLDRPGAAARDREPPPARLGVAVEPQPPLGGCTRVRRTAYTIFSMHPSARTTRSYQKELRVGSRRMGAPS